MRDYWAVEEIYQRLNKSPHSYLKDIKIKDLYQGYKSSLKSLRKVATSLQFKNQEILQSDTKDYKALYVSQQDLSLVNQMIKEVSDILEMLEGYLDLSDREILQREIKKRNKEKILNKRCIVGYVPEMDIVIEDPQDLISSYYLQDKVTGLVDLLLSEQNAIILKLYFFEFYNQEEISEKLGVSQQLVSKKLNESINILRKSELFEEYLRKSM